MHFNILNFDLYLIFVCPGLALLRPSELFFKENKNGNEHEMTSNKKKVQWKYLPDDIWNLIFLNYCDFDSLVNSRVLQTKYVKECTESNDIIDAIKGSNLKNMKWIYEFKEGFEWFSYFFDVAAEYGNIKIMKWMKTKGCPWDEDTFQYAAEYCDGHNFEVLEWLRINNCPWDDETFCEDEIKQPVVIEWLINHSMTIYSYHDHAFL